MKLKSIKIINFRSILQDEVEFNDFTFFVGRNNYGKSNYLKAIENLLSFSAKYSDVQNLQNDKTQPVIIEGVFDGVSEFTPNLTVSGHKAAVETLTKDGLVKLRLTITPDGEGETLLVDFDTDKTSNPTGWSSIYKKIFPEVIFIPATADTAQELQEKAGSALSKIKKEVMRQFFTNLASKIELAFEPLDKYLNGEEQDRSPELKELEKDLGEEMMGEFSTVKPSVKFGLPDSAVIGKGMTIDLHDGFHDSEIGEKGNGLQRTTLFALLRLLSKHQIKQKTKPSPIFLIEEMEIFLHPSAQQRLADSMALMSEKYQTIVTTHSPFVLSPKILDGYRKVNRTEKLGSKCASAKQTTNTLEENKIIKNVLAQTGNLISLFSDKIVVLEGKEDVGFYSVLLDIFKLQDNKGLISFVEAVQGGCDNLHISVNFFKMLGFDDVSVICDLDCLFDTRFKNLLKSFDVDSDFIDEFRSGIGWSSQAQPGLENVLRSVVKIQEKVDAKIHELAQQKIYILRLGSPEKYFQESFVAQHEEKVKTIWKYLAQESELKETQELKSICENIIAE